MGGKLTAYTVEASCLLPHTNPHLNSQRAEFNRSDCPGVSISESIIKALLRHTCRPLASLKCRDSLILG